MQNIFDKIMQVIKNPLWIMVFLNNRGFHVLDDVKYIKLVYKLSFNASLNLDEPTTFNEKLQWLKLYNRKTEYTNMVDKYEVKEYISNIIGKQYVIPTLGIYNNWKEINFEELPNQFVIKATHDSGSVVICKNKEDFNYNKAKKIINNALKRNFFWIGREWPYKNVKPRIIIEKYMEDDYYHELIDYKIYAFNGRCDYVMACFDRNIGRTKFIYFDREWNMKKEFSKDGMQYGDCIKNVKPKNLKKMFQIAEKLSIGIPFVRIDFYEVNGSLYVGELTFFPSSGFDDTRTEECKNYLNNMLNIIEA